MDGFYGEIRIFGFNYPPENWLPCDGRLVSINEYAALYSVIGNAYGNNPPAGKFYLPNLQGQVVQGQGTKPDNPPLASSTGSESVSLNTNQLPSHNHTVTTSTFPAADKSGDVMTSVPATNSALFHLITGAAPGTNGKADACYVPTGATVALLPDSISSVGGNSSGAAEAHENRQPFLVMNFCICTEGEYPTPAQ